MPKPPIAEVAGLVYVTSRAFSDIGVEHHYYTFAPDATMDAVHALLNAVSDVRELMFFDAEHPQISDPGAYIHAERGPTGVCSWRALQARKRFHSAGD